MQKVHTAALVGGLCLLLAGHLFAQEDPTTVRDSEGKAVSRQELEEMKEALNGLSESFTEYRNYVDALR